MNPPTNCPRNHKPIAIALLGLLAIAFALACGGGGSSKKIVFGSVYNLTGSQAVLDVPSWHGSALAVSEINANGGVLGRDLSAVAVDSDPQTLSAGIEELFNNNADVVALLGLSDTDMVLNAAPVAAAHDRVFLSSGATSPKLPGQIPSYLFLACFGDNVQAAAGAEWAYNDLEARTALVLFDPSKTYPDLLQGYFIDRFVELGGTIAAAQSIDPQAGQLDLPPTDNVDLVFLSVETADDAANVIPMLRASGYDGPILGGDGYDAESTWAALPDVSNVYFTTHVYLGADIPNPKVGEFLDAYAAAYPGEAPSAFAALGYDAVYLLAAAIERAGDATPAGVLDGLTGLQDFAGVTGTISYLDDDRIPTKSVSILQIADGKQNFVKEVLPESVPAP